jgi:MinD-like ATPase involved in chromosome partitioning or flagellar assembly
MSGFVCPKCGAQINIFSVGGGEKIAQELSVPYLGEIPIDPSICTNSDSGIPFVDKNVASPTAEAFAGIVTKIEKFLINE